jgi:chromosome segregation ATPase
MRPNRKNPFAKAEGATPEATDNRDARIEELERAVAAERQHSASLRNTADELRFKADILEKSYAKQLEEARLRREAAENDLTEHRVRIAELDSARADAIQLLTDAKAELDRLTAERNQLRRKLASDDGRSVPGAGAAAEEASEDGTINTLMDDSRWSRKPVPGDDQQAEARSGQGAADDPPAEDMIAPDLVFTTAKRED